MIHKCNSQHELEIQSEKFIDLNLKSRVPTILFFQWKKFWSVFYDIESMWLDDYDVFRKNPEYEKLFRIQITQILEEIPYKDFMGRTPFSWMVLWIPVEYVVGLAKKIDNLLLEFKTKFV